MEMFEILYRLSSQTATCLLYCWNLESTSHEIENENVSKWRETFLKYLEFISSTIIYWASTYVAGGIPEMFPGLTF